MNCYLRIPLMGAFLFAALTSSHAQDDERSLRNLFIEAETYFLFEEYRDALPLYQQIFRVEPTNYNVCYKIGICYLNDRYNKQKSINYLKQAVNHINPDCKLNSFKEKKAPPEAEFDLGVAYRKAGYIDQALEIFTNFRKKANPELYDFDLIDDEILSCRRLMELSKHPIHFEMDNELGLVNSQYAEINPVLSGNGNTLVFTRKLPFYDGVFISYKQQDGTWSEPNNLTGDFGLDGNSYTTGISYNGDEIFVYRSDEYDGNIYASRLKGQKWGQLVKLGDNINTKYWESHASPSPDNKYLYFTSNRRGGYGGLDIYKSERQANGSWGEAVNLGPIVNSKYNEETPFLSKEGKVLYFSSQGHESSGGYDVFLSELDKNGAWGKPENIGYPFNTSDDDLFFQPNAENNFGFQARYVVETTKGLDDIYRIEIFNRFNPRVFIIKGTLTKESGTPQELPHISINLLNAVNGQMVTRCNMTAEGNFEIDATQGKYNLQVQGKGIEPILIPITINALQATNTIVLDTLHLKDFEIKDTEQLASRSVSETSSDAPRLEPVRNFYMADTDELLPIELIVDKNNYLQVDILQGDSLIRQELFKTQRKKFTYYYAPLPGESVVAFTITDGDSNTNYTEVRVRYDQLLIAPTEPIASAASGAANELVNFEGFYPLITSAALSDYMSTLDLSKFNSLTELYANLLKNSSHLGYLQSDADKLMAVLSSQKELNSFMSQVHSAYPVSEDMNELGLGLRIPLYKLYLLESLTNSPSERIDYTNAMLSVLASDGITDNEAANYLLSFDYANQAQSISGNRANMNASALANALAEKDSINLVLNLAASTTELNFFYQNLLFTADDNIRGGLSALKFDKAGVHNSIDLVQYLLEHSDKFGVSKTEMFDFIQTAKLNWQNNIHQFINILSENAVGKLKEELEGLKNNARYYSNFQDIVSQVCVYSQEDAVSREALYRLFMDISGTYSTDSLLSFIERHGFDIFAEPLKNVTRYTHSTPYEVLQHLLAMASINGYGESDICDMLLYLLLEKGMKKQQYYNQTDSSGKLIKNRSFLHAVVLVNIGLVLIILIIILRRRSKEKQNENDLEIQ